MTGRLAGVVVEVDAQIVRSHGLREIHGTFRTEGEAGDLFRETYCDYEGPVLDGGIRYRMRGEVIIASRSWDGRALVGTFTASGNPELLEPE